MGARVRLTFAESAIVDLEDVRAWHTEQGVPEVGERLVREVYEQAERLVVHPDLGRVVPEFGNESLRELIRSPFRIVYRRDPARVRVVRVWRGERLMREM